MKPLHDTDFYSWTQEQAALLLAGRVSEIDFINLADEVKDMGISEARTLESRLEVLIMHLLKWKYQPEKIKNGWEITIKEQRKRIEKHLKKNPGLKPLLKLKTDESLEFFSDRYQFSVFMAKQETILNNFPDECPFTMEQILDESFFPSA